MITGYTGGYICCLFYALMHLIRDCLAKYILVFKPGRRRRFEAYALSGNLCSGLDNIAAYASVYVINS